MEEDDFYAVLDLPQEADEKQIKEAYRRAAFQFHPDRNQDAPGSAEKMKKVNEAYAVLSNPEKRREYDALRRRFGTSAARRFKRNYSEQDIFSGSDIQAVFEEMARAFGFRGFDEIFREYPGKGGRSFTFKSPGVFARGYVYTASRGKDKSSGTVFPTMVQKALTKLTRYAAKKISGVDIPEGGSDEFDEIYLTFEQAKNGGPYAYFHRKKDRKLVVKVPPGIKENGLIRLSGMGGLGKSGGKHGDLYLKVKFNKPLIQKVKDMIGFR
jgi:DnaJ-class molecular chaperone